jgi:hypothetical protein
VIPDCHFPHQHQAAYRLMLKVGAALGKGRGPAEVLLLGDFADFWAVSAHDKEAQAERLLGVEVAAVNAELDRLDSLWPRAKKTYLEGNHEHRLTRYLGTEAPALDGLVECRTLFRMSARPNWTWIPYGPGQLVRVGASHLYARHEPLTGGVLPAHGTVLKAGCSVIYGHDHKSQQAQVVMANGDTHLGVSVGWLGDQRKAAFRYVKGLFNWCLGFGIVTYDPKSGVFFVDTVRIIRQGKTYHCFANGRWHSVRD